MRDDGAFQRHDRPAGGKRLGDGGQDIDEGAGGFRRHVCLRDAAVIAFRPAAAQGPAPRRKRPPSRSGTAGRASRSPAAPRPCPRAAPAASPAPRSSAAIVAPASASPAPVTSATCRGGRRLDGEDARRRRSRAPGPAPAVITPAAKPCVAQPLDDRVARPAASMPASAAASRAVHEQAGKRRQHAGQPHHLGRRDGDGEDRLAGGERHQLLQARRPAGWRRTAPRRPPRPPRAPWSGASAWERRARRAPCRRARRPRRRRGRAAPCSSASRGRGTPPTGRQCRPRRWRAPPRRRPRRRRAPTSALPPTPRCTALRSALKAPPPTSSRIDAGVGGARHEVAAHLAAPVDMGAADREDVRQGHCLSGGSRDLASADHRSRTRRWQPARRIIAAVARAATADRRGSQAGYIRSRIG